MFFFCGLSAYKCANALVLISESLKCMYFVQLFRIMFFHMGTKTYNVQISSNNYPMFE